MNPSDPLQSLLAQPATEAPVAAFLMALVVTALLASLLGRIYVRCGRALSNRRDFARNFMLISVTTMLVISIVKSSLALSLGLVGALSIVRFRAAIKEPEELTYLFVAIAIGLGMGAQQWLITLTAFLAIAAIILLKERFTPAEDRQNLYLTVSGRTASPPRLEDMVGVLTRSCPAASLTRFDESGDSLEAAFLVEFDDFDQLSAVHRELQALGESLTISFMDAKAVT